MTSASASDGLVIILVAVIILIRYITTSASVASSSVLAATIHHLLGEGCEYSRWRLDFASHVLHLRVLAILCLPERGHLEEMFSIQLLISQTDVLLKYFFHTICDFDCHICTFEAIFPCRIPLFSW